jgi:hypothetical protein
MEYLPWLISRMDIYLSGYFGWEDMGKVDWTGLDNTFLVRVVCILQRPSVMALDSPVCWVARLYSITLLHSIHHPPEVHINRLVFARCRVL